MTLQRIPIYSPNYSSRSGARVTHIVLHTAEGATTYQSLGAYFKNPNANVSSHVGIDDTPGVVGEYVTRPNKAWTASAANPWSVQAELCAFARWTHDEWMTHPTMLDNTAAWIAEEAAAFNIPLVGLDSHNAQTPSAMGVCQHADLGRMGGGHWDCGPGFPFDHVLALARGQSPGPGPTPPSSGDEDVLHIVKGDRSNEWWLTDWITKRYIDSPDEAAQIVVSTVKTGGKIEQNNNGPVVYPEAVVEHVPRNDA